MELGQVIGKLIKQKKLTQVEVAQKIGKSPTALSQMIKGTYNPNPETLEKICNVLEIPQPILYFLTISEKDIPADKLELYKMLAPALRDFVYRIFGDEVNTLEESISMN
jgi:transcriptional regulator with XRE-family HTH domain